MSGNKSLRILVADDNRINRAVVRGMLEYAGHQVDTVADGKNALDALEKQTYDLVIMDCLMPVMDGFATTRNIRAASAPGFDSNIPILAITALASAEDQRRCLDAGMSGYISKPVMARDLFAWIALHLKIGPQSAGGKAGVTADRKPTPGAAELIRNMSPRLVRDAGQWRQQLRTLCDTRQLGELGALAHKIRGTADVLGIRKLSAIAAKLEKSGKEGDTIKASAQASQLIDALRTLISEMQQPDPASPP